MLSRKSTGVPRALIHAILVTAALAVAVTPASAVPTIFNNRAAFLAAAGGALNFEGFEASFANAPSQTFPGFSLTETGGTNIVAHHPTVSNFPGTSLVTSGTGAAWFDDNGSSVGTFLFNSPINAFGIDVTTSMASLVAIGGAATTALNLAAMQSQFVGIIDFSGTFTTITFTPSGGPNIGWDTLEFGNARSVPEPATLILLGVGLAGLALLRRRSS